MSTAICTTSPEIDKEPHLNEPVQASNVGGDRPVTILVAEDDPTIRAFVVLVLKDQGYRVLEAENGRHALDQWADYSGSIDALITDAVMPETNGRELAEQARRIWPDIKILVISGYVDRGFKNEDPSSPSSAFLGKPFSEDGLAAAIQSLCPSIRTA